MTFPHACGCLQSALARVIGTRWIASERRNQYFDGHLAKSEATHPPSSGIALKQIPHFGIRNSRSLFDFHLPCSKSRLRSSWPALFECYSSWLVRQNERQRKSERAVGTRSTLQVT